MRRIVGYEQLLFAVAVGLMAGCSNSSSPSVAERTNAEESQVDVVLPDSAAAVYSTTGETAGPPARLADDSNAATSELNPQIADLANSVDSDEPGTYEFRSANQTGNSSPEESQPLNQAAGDEGAQKRNGRKQDGDDPEAPLLIAKVAEEQVDVPLNDGREPSTKPLPEGQRVADASVSVEPAAHELGRDPNAKPGAEVKTPAKTATTTKPAAPTRSTLADLSEAIQALDKDSDGQIGVYEWPREKLAEFKNLDSDKDGFLTPAELVAGQKKASDEKSTTGDKEAEESSETKAKEKAEEKPKAKAEAKAEEDSPSEDTKAATEESTGDEKTSDTPQEEADGEDDTTADEEATQGS